jgi:Tol biopolymer transport system component
LLSGVDSPVTFSPDGKRMAFVRGDYPNPNESALVIANADGSGEQAVARRQPPERFFPIWFTGPSWSPDGKLIACAMARSEGGEYAGVTVVRVEDGRERALTRRRWQLVSRVEWLADGSGLMMIAADQPSSPHQVWYLSYPNGEARSINNDLSSYRCLSLTSDSTKLVSIRQTVPMNIWLVPDGDANRARQIVSGQDVGTQSICWVPDGRVIYSLDVDGNTDLWALQPDAGNRKQLTAKAGNNFSPTVSPDGRFVVFVSTRAGANNIWRIDLDGGNPQQLSRGDDDFSPTFSPDGQWVFYSSSAPETRGLWRVPAAGGDPQRLTDVLYHRAVISPDGRQIACTYTDGPSGGERETKIAVIPIDGGGPTKTYDLQTDSIASPDIVWSADGQSLIYNVVRDNVSNLWRRPLSGGPATQVTDFKSDLIITFAWSRDGKQLVCTRGSSIRDAVLISDIR